MANVQTVSFDNLRSLGFASISGTYAKVGTKLLHPVRLICFTNDTDGDMIFSDDGVNDKIFVVAGSFKLFDLTTNKLNATKEWVIPVNTQFSVKESSPATSGAVYIECLWGE